MARSPERDKRSVPHVRLPGLSVVELVMEIEQVFHLTIPDREARTIVTVGDIKNYLASRVRLGSSTDCVTQRAFYRLRSVVCGELTVPRSLVRPSSAWKDLLPAHGRRWVWGRIVKRARLPRQPPWNVAGLRWKLPIYRDTVGSTARLIAAAEPVSPRGPDESWTRGEISRAVDRLVMDVCEVTDFSDDVFLEDGP